MMKAGKPKPKKCPAEYDSHFVPLDELTLPDMSDFGVEEPPENPTLKKARNKYIAHFRKLADHEEIDYGVEQLFGAASKVGPKQIARTFNITREHSCFLAQPDDLPIATPFCTETCYVNYLESRAHRDKFDPKNHYWRRSFTNVTIAERSDFDQIVIGALLHEWEESFHQFDLLRLHSSGELFSVEYIVAWSRIAKQIYRLTEGAMTIFCYTRSWTKAHLLPALAKLAAVPNFYLILSYDCDTGLPPSNVLPMCKTAPLLDGNDEIPDIVGRPRDITVFRSRPYYE